MTVATDAFVTNDMTLAAVLSMHGHRATLREGAKKGQCDWWFEAHDHTWDLAEKYNSGELRLEPLRLVKEVAEVRKRMYAFLDAAEAE